MKRMIFVIVALLVTVSACAKEETTVRVGHFPNVAHAQALIMHERGDLKKNLSSFAKVDWKIFNAGSSATEAMFAGQLDIAYIGPSPAINAFVKSNGEAVRIVAGAASGGAALVVRSDSGIENAEDFRGKKIATPQLGNTQDVALRSWLKKNGLTLKEKGGDVSVLPLSNADQQTLYIKKEIDAAWTTEPWVSLLTHKSGGRIFLDEASLWPNGKYATTVILVRTAFLKQNPLLVKKFLELHVEVTDWMSANTIEAKSVVKQAIEKETNKEIPSEIMDAAWSRIEFSVKPRFETITMQGQAAYEAGYLKKKPDLSGLLDRTLLDEIIGKRHEK